MLKTLGNIYGRSIAMYLELYLLVLFGDCGNLLIDKKFFKILYLCFFTRKTEELVLEKGS